MTTVGEPTQMRPGYRQPPHSREAEESVIGAMLLSVDAVNDVMDQVHPEDFYIPAHQAIFEAMRELFDTNQAIDAVTVSESLRRRGELEKVGGVQYLTRLVDIVPSTSNVVYYASIVEEHAKRRELIRAGAAVTEFAFNIDDEIAGVLDRAEQAVLGVAEKRASQTLLEVGPMFQDVLEHIEMLEQQGSEITGLATGFVDLDKKLAGLQPSNLVIIAGRPAMGKCLSEHSKIVDPATGALRRIGEMAPVGNVAALEESTLNLVRGRQTDWVDQGMQETFKVVTRLGRSITATANHPFRTIHGWVELTDLAPGVEIAVSGHVDAGSQGAELTDAEVALIAYMIGDGTCTCVTPRFTNTDPDVVADVGRWAAELDLKLSKRAGHPHYRLRKRTGRGRENELTTLLKEHDLHGRTAHDKHVPEVIFRSPKRQIALFLNRLYACDGSAWIDKDNYRIEYCTVSEQLADDIQHLLLRFGIVAKKRIRMVGYQGTRRRAFDISFQDPDNVERFVGHIGAYGKMERMADVLQVALNRKVNAAAHELLPMEVWDLVLAEKGDTLWADISEATGRPRNHNWHVKKRRLSKRLLEEIAKALSSNSLLTLAHSDIIWDPVVSIEAAGAQQTYDLTIQGHHNFVANDIVVHNSSLALNIATNVAGSDDPVAIFSLEMSKEEIVQRILSSVGKVDSMKIRSGQLGPLWQRVVDAAGRMYKAPIYIDDSPVVTVTDIRAKCRRLKRKKGLSLVVVDYLQLMESHGGENRQQEIAQISRNLKNLARELEVPIIAASQLNRSLESREDKRPRLSDLRESGCMPASTRLLRADTNEEVTLGELVLSQEQPLVWSVDDRWQMTPRRLLKAFPSGIKSVYRLRLASGHEVEATGNHKFLTVEGWRSLESLGAGGFIAVPRVIPKPTDGEDQLSDDELILLAHLLGDGSIGPNVRYATSDPANKAIVEETAWRLFGVETNTTLQGRTWQMHLASPYRLTHGRHHPIRNWLEPMGLWGSRSHTKFVPESVHRHSDEKIALFLHHLWATDGSITLAKNGRGPHTRIYYATTSRQLAEGVRRLLLRLDIRSRVARARKSGYRDGWHVRVTGKEDSERFLSMVGSHGKRGEVVPEAKRILAGIKPNPNVDLIPWEVAVTVRDSLARSAVTHRELASHLGEGYCGSYLLGSRDRPRRFSRDRLRRIGERLGDEDLINLATSDMFWDEIVEITLIGEMPTFDATVEGTHNFIADGVVAHNSLEQDSDVVMFVYRHEYYHPEDQDKKGIAEVIVAKHRAGSTGPVEMTFQPEFTRFANLGRDVT